MKKWMLVLVALFVSVSAFSQSCLDDVWQCLRSNQIPKAKKFMDAFRERNKTYICNEILGCDITTAAGLEYARSHKRFEAVCPQMVALAVNILDGIMS